LKADNVVDPPTQALTADAPGIKLTSLEAAAPHYPATRGRLDHYREHAGR
jgi:NADH dehydrogenase